ncbi:MAG: NAAT family transporter [Acidobacteria bacterium]|nr:NAAT family transporter [Acidobacteriota bacterium]MBV9437820.1 NAAT family transporter [Acidobacteriota bacterium]
MGLGPLLSLTTLHFFSQLIRSIVVVVAALFPIVNPLGSALLFLSLTRGYAPELRQALVLRITINSFLLLVVSILIGSHVLHFFGVSIPVVQVAGGTIVAATGWSLLRQKDGDPKPRETNPATATQQAFYPLTLPITVGPGSISVAITLGANNAGHIYSLDSLPVLISSFIGAFIVALSVYVCYRSAERLERILGEVGLSVFLRLSAFIVICIGVQITWNGVAALVHSLYL